MQGYYFNTTNPYRDWPSAFAEGQEKAREGDLNAAVLLLEAAILQDPQDYEVTNTGPVLNANIFFMSDLLQLQGLTGRPVRGKSRKNDQNFLKTTACPGKFGDVTVRCFITCQSITRTPESNLCDGLTEAVHVYGNCSFL